jgi:hypothetical protein
MYEKRVGEEVDHARMDERARVVAEPTTPPVEEGGDVECPVDDVKYAAAWFDADEEPEADEMSPSRERAESSKVEAAAMSETQRAEVEERAKLAAGMEPDEAWSPIERIGEEIMELGQHVDRVAAKAGITKKQALTILCEKRLETGSAAKAAMKAAADARNYFKSAPAPITEVHHRQYTTTVEGEVTHLFTPMNSNEHQVALIEDTLTGNSFKFLIHERTRRSRAWTEWNGDEIVTDLREGDVVKIIDGKPQQLQPI